MAIFTPRPQPYTLAYRRFLEKNSELSTIHWMHVVGSEAITKGLTGANKASLAVDALGIPTKQQFYGYSAGDTLQLLDQYLNRCRLHLLVICCANLEAFLKDVTFCYVAGMGYKAAPGKLSITGAALAAPILDSNSLPSNSNTRCLYLVSILETSSRV
jgi:hypothetical protein